MPIHPFLNRIIHGDCVQVMQTIPAESVDLIVTDPPYLGFFARTLELVHEGGGPLLSP